MSHDLIIQHYIYEIEGWERLVDFLTLENVFFKTRLAELVNDNIGEEILIDAEKFQDDFMAQDRVLSFLSTELKQQSKILSKNQQGNMQPYEEIVKNQAKLREDISKAEGLFAKVKSQFSEYLSEHFQYFKHH